mgnify:CR=1 FL=1
MLGFFKVVQPLVSLARRVCLILALSRWLMWLGCLSKLVKWLPVCCLYPKRNKFYLLRRKLRCLGSSHSTLLQPLPVAFASRKKVLRLIPSCASAWKPFSGSRPQRKRKRSAKRSFKRSGMRTTREPYGSVKCRLPSRGSHPPLVLFLRPACRAHRRLQQNNFACSVVVPCRRPLGHRLRQPHVCVVELFHRQHRQPHSNNLVYSGKHSSLGCPTSASRLRPSRLRKRGMTSVRATCASGITCPKSAKPSGLMPLLMAAPPLPCAKRSVFKNLRRASDRVLHRSLQMPFKSQAQRRALYAKDPALAREFERKTPKGKKLPKRVKPKKKR